MPFLSVKTSASLDERRKMELQRALGELITVIPGKTIDNCITDIEDGRDMFRHGEKALAAFVDLRLFTAAPDDAKQMFMEGLCKLLKDKLNIEPINVYCNFVEFDQWGAGGRFNRAAKG